MTEKQIKAFKTIFATSITAFEISEIWGGNPKNKKLKSLNKKGLRLINKISHNDSTQVNPELIELLNQMAMIAVQPVRTNPDFKRGGVIHKK